MKRRSKEELEWISRYTSIHHLVLKHGGCSEIPLTIRTAVSIVTVAGAFSYARTTLIETMSNLFPSSTLIRMIALSTYSPFIRTIALAADADLVTLEYPLSRKYEVEAANYTARGNQSGSLLLDNVVLALVDCPYLEVLSSCGEVRGLICPNLIRLELPMLPNLPSALASLRTLILEDVGENSSLYDLSKSTPSLKSLIVGELTLLCVVTHRLPKSLTRLRLTGPVNTFVILDPDMKLECLSLGPQYGRAGSLPSSLVILELGMLAMCELTHCRHLKKLAYHTAVDEEEWPSSLTGLNIKADSHRLPRNLPPRLRTLIVFRNNPSSVLFDYFDYFSHNVTNLDDLIVNFSLSIVQLQQFRGSLLVCNNTKDELQEVQTRMPRSIVIPSTHN